MVTVVVLALVVIAVDEFTAHHLVYFSFRSGRFVPDGRDARSRWERALRTLGHRSLRLPLARVAAVDEQAAQNRDLADVVVHRGFSPFIGAGKQIHRHIIALPLQPAEATEGQRNGQAQHHRGRGINVAELQQYVAAAMDGLRSSSSLCPSGRLQGLVQREQVLMSAEALLTYRDTPLQHLLLPDPHHPPATHLPTAAARQLADTPQEGARYYRCFRIESWDRALTTSCYLHVGTDQRMLFLEWTFCILPPIRPSYREIDRLQHPLAPLHRSLLELVVLPATVLSRYRSVFYRFRPLPQRSGKVDPDRYGADQSLRELAADDDVQTYFQDVDTERYVKILDATLFRAVGHYLEDRDYSVVEFMKQADPVVNNQLNVSGGTFLGSAVGYGNTAKGNTNRSVPPKGKP